MEQYKVILVDDEVEVIDIMKQKIRWNDLGFDVVRPWSWWKSFSRTWC